LFVGIRVKVYELKVVIALHTERNHNLSKLIWSSKTQLVPRSKSYLSLYYQSYKFLKNDKTNIAQTKAQIVYLNFNLLRRKNFRESLKPTGQFKWCNVL